jgi:UDP-GlcNAc:undecaprenyl-phosphate/decaprenyl-phosphate GlcNAc-1-phosphate transferase
MPEYLRILLAFALGAAPAVVLCRLVIFLGVVDAPTEARKTQKVAVPTLGGLGVAAAVAVSAFAIFSITTWVATDMVFIAYGGAVAALALGLADDITKVPALSRFLLMVAIALTIAVLGLRANVLEPWPDIVIQLPAALAVLGSVIWLVVVINAVNFMDGANGLSMGMAAIAAAGLAASAGLIGAWNLALLAAALSGALAGFLVWNVPGKLFVGDTGALFTGTLLAALCLELVRLRPDLLFVPPILMMPFLSDVLLTLIWRMKHGKKIAEAHRDHVYQIALKAGLKHWQVSAIHAFWAFNAAIVGIIAAVVGGQVPLLAFLVVLAVAIWVHAWVRKLGVKAGLVGAEIA